MKLYKEEQVRKAIDRGYSAAMTQDDPINSIADNFLEILKPIELPSEDEIERKSRNHCNIQQDLIIDDEERYYQDFTKYDTFIEGAKWVIEQIKKQTQKQHITNVMNADAKDGLYDI